MRRRLFFLIPALLLVLLYLFVSVFGQPEITVRKGYENPMIPDSFRQLIAEKSSLSVPELYLDGEQVTGADPYRTSGGDLMIPVDLLKGKLGLYISAVSEDLIFVCRGDRKITMNVMTDEVTSSGETAVIGGAALKANDMYYISADFLSEMFGFSREYDSESHIYAMESPAADYLPSAFSLYEVNRGPQVLDQGESGNCWAYASLSALESFLLPDENTLFSRMHMVENNSFLTTEYSGGESGIAVSYLLSWQGPVPGSYDQSAESDAFSSVKHVQGIMTLDHADAGTVKEAVYRYGGVEASLYLAMADADNLYYVDHYYNAEAAAYYYNGTKAVNHDIVIVGWDDDYPAEKFVLNDGIGGNGAYLCQNSYGEGFGDGGLFWVSYYDSRICTEAVCFTDVEDSDNYSAVYQTDLSGATANAGYGVQTAYFANIYTAEADSYIRAAGFYTLGKENDYEIYFVHDAETSADLPDAEFVTSGSIGYAGYSTITFPTGKRVEKGERFAIIVKLTTKDSQYPVAVEKVTDYAPNVDITDGEGYISSNGSLYRNTEENSAGNVCLKAYADVLD